MHSSTAFALTVAALAAGTALASPAPRAAAPEHRSRFTAVIGGDVATLLAGRAVQGVVGAPGAPGSAYTITLGAPQGGGAIVLTRNDGRVPPVGRHPVGNAAALDSIGGFRAVYIAGSAARPLGVFQAVAGTVEILEHTPDGPRGSFDLLATGFLARDPDDESRRVTIRGHFDR